MSKAEQFWHYAEEAMIAARQSKSETEKKVLMDLARIWALAAMQSLGVNACPPETKAA